MKFELHTFPSSLLYMLGNTIIFLINTAKDSIADLNKNEVVLLSMLQTNKHLNVHEDTI